MKLKHWITLLILTSFLVLSSIAINELGYVGLWMAGFSNIGSLQILLDLIIACGIAMGWIIKDAKERGLNAWPYLVITIFTGSIGLLLYLLLRDRQPSPKKALAD